MELVKKSFELDIGPFEMTEIGKVSVCTISGNSMIEPLALRRNRMGVCIFSYSPDAIASVPRDFVHYYPMEELALMLEGSMDMGLGEEVNRSNEKHYAPGQLVLNPYGVPMWENFNTDGKPCSILAWWIGSCSMYDMNGSEYKTTWRKAAEKQEGGETNHE